MRPNRTCSGILSASLVTWLLLMPPLSISPAGKTSVDTGAPLSRWETLSTHADDTACRKHRDSLRAALAKSAAETQPVKKDSGKDAEKSKVAFATLRQRAAAARCLASSDPRLRAPSASPAPR